MRKIWKCAAVSALGVALLTGCGDRNAAANRIAPQNAVENALKEGIDKAESGGDSAESKAEESKAEENKAEEKESEEKEVGEEAVEEEADIDLSRMSGDMVYATVYQLMIAPEEYVGKKIRVRGNYYASWYEPTERYYHYVLIADALACCSQGLEFIWDDGGHELEEYPEYLGEIEVVGTFATYMEEGDPNVYCTLRDASMKLVSF